MILIILDVKMVLLN